MNNNVRSEPSNKYRVGANYFPRINKVLVTG